jgi:hypothetical protein
MRGVATEKCFSVLEEALPAAVRATSDDASDAEIARLRVGTLQARYRDCLDMQSNGVGRPWLRRPIRITCDADGSGTYIAEHQPCSLLAL